MTAVVSLVQSATRAPLPATPPISGPVWTILVPAVLFLVALAGTWLLWRHFAHKDGPG